MNSISLELTNELCTGCCACMCICPVCAIEMRYNKEGFLYPYVDSQKCIECRKCIKSCPLKRKNENIDFIDAYNAYSNKKEEVRMGSSGGIFPLIAKNIIDSDGIVFGPVYDKERKIVRHVSSEHYDLDSICRSKYVQSHIENIFSEVRQKLDSKNLVLFCGTPCQITGLKLYLQKKYNNLYTIDFICHGVPSPKVFSDYIRMIERKYRSDVINFTFREKDFGWRDQHIKIYLSNGRVLSRKSKYNTYYQLFTQNYILRRSCHSCKLFNRHQADITLADAWNEKSSEGISRVYINTSKGKDLFEQIKSQLTYKHINREKINMNMYSHEYKSGSRKYFFSKYKTDGNNNKLFNLCKLRCLAALIENKIRKKV